MAARAQFAGRLAEPARGPQRLGARAGRDPDRRRRPHLGDRAAAMSVAPLLPAAPPAVSVLIRAGTRLAEPQVAGMAPARPGEVEADPLNDASEALAALVA